MVEKATLYCFWEKPCVPPLLTALLHEFCRPRHILIDSQGTVSSIVHDELLHAGRPYNDVWSQGCLHNTRGNKSALMFQSCVYNLRLTTSVLAVLWWIYPV